MVNFFTDFGLPYGVLCMYGLIKICLQNLSQFQHCAYLNDLAWPIVNFSQSASRNLSHPFTIDQQNIKGCVCKTSIDADGQYQRF